MGYDRKGFNKNGFDKAGYAKGYDKHGYNGGYRGKHNFTKYRFSDNGWLPDNSGYDHYGLDQDGYDKDGNYYWRDLSDSEMVDTKRYFGEFECQKMNCKQKWKSGNTWTNKYQQCKRCQTKSQPKVQVIIKRVINYDLKYNLIVLEKSGMGLR